MHAPHKLLAALRRDFSTDARDRRLALFRSLHARLPSGTSTLVALHDELLYALAYPADAACASACAAALTRVAETLARAAGRHADRATAPADDTGIAGTCVRTTFSLAHLHWLIARNPHAAEVDWRADGAEPAVDTLLPLVTAQAEIDGVLSNSLATRAWLERARSAAATAVQHPTALAWLITEVMRAIPQETIRDHVWESAEVPIRVRLAQDSRTHTRFPARPIWYQSEPLARGTDLPALLERQLPSPLHLIPRDRRGLIDTARAVLGARGRETDPVSHANAQEVTLYRLERGVDVALFGMIPSRRLPIESYFGFVAARNRVPIAYGGGWVWLGRCEIGVNLFEEFRGGESAFIFSQVLRVYRQHFGAAQFLVPPYQFGADNDEALRSGAFWFYYRLGFRPVAPNIRALADAEAARLAAQAGARSPRRVLRRLATCKLYLDVSARGMPSAAWTPAAADLEQLGLSITRWIESRRTRSRSTPRGAVTRAALRALGSPGIGSWSADEKQALTTLAPLVAMLAERGAWSPRGRSAMLAAIRAKGGPTELTYVRQMRRAWRLVPLTGAGDDPR